MKHYSPGKKIVIGLKPLFDALFLAPAFIMKLQMKIKKPIKDFWGYLKKDTWDSWIVSMLLIVVVIKFVFFPLLTLATGSPLPLVVVESCSMYHETNFDDWWSKNAQWYQNKGISKEEFKEYNMKNGLNKGDIILVTKPDEYEKGDIIIFLPNPESTAVNPIIHRIISENPISTKGDHNTLQFTKNNNIKKLDETDISKERILGKSTLRIPYVGWAKLIWFELSRPEQERGFCN